MAIIGFIYELNCSPKTDVFSVLWPLERIGLKLNPKSAYYINRWEGWLFQPLQNTPLSVQIRERTSTIKGNSSNLLAKTRYTHAKEASMVFWASELCRFWMPISFYAPAISGQQFEALRGGRTWKLNAKPLPSLQASKFHLCVWFGSASFQCPSISVFIQYFFGQLPKPC